MSHRMTNDLTRLEHQNVLDNNQAQTDAVRSTLSKIRYGLSNQITDYVFLITFQKERSQEK